MTLFYLITLRKDVVITTLLRMSRAKILLNNTTLSVADITDVLEYSNTSNFHKAYKSYFGDTSRKA